MYADVEPVVESCTKDSCETVAEDPVVDNVIESVPAESETVDKVTTVKLTKVVSEQPWWIWALVISILIALGYFGYKKFMV